ncbi:MAG: hypothetical protein JWP44_4565, partial [Mucilaginibacter sp.]|nr:hypothetical protein [Mucilaginibacter sp.]
MVGGERPGRVIVRAMALAGLTMDGHNRADSAGFAWSGPWTSCLPSCNKPGGLHALVMQLAPGDCRGLSEPMRKFERRSCEATPHRRIAALF